MFKSVPLFLFFVFTIICSNAQLNISNSFKIGESVFSVKHNCENNKPVLFIHLHESETTAINTMMDSLDNGKAYCLAAIKQHGKRFLSIRFRRKQHLIDPNRIFTSNGTRNSYQKINRYYSSTVVEDAIRAGNKILTKFVRDRKLVIAIHNNRDSEFSIDQYQGANIFARAAARLHKNDTMDIDNFILTTEENVFEYFSKKDINVVLLSSRMQDDGSLSVYCMKNNIPYINLEIQLGDIAMQRKLLSEVLQFVEGMEP